MTSPLISTEELAAILGQANVRVLDSSWHLDGRNARTEFDQKHIPGAIFFDLEAISDQASDLPHMLPTPAAFAASMGVLGVSDTDAIVVYDTAGLFSAARAWWMLTIMGAANVRVLDGGLPKWVDEGRPVEFGHSWRRPFVVFRPRFDAAVVAEVGAVTKALEHGDQVADARGAARFRGDEEEPRPGVRPGHMPGAINLPYSTLLNPDGTMKRGPALSAVFMAAGIDPAQPIITTCGSGVTAAILSLALVELGHPSRLYDGSWAEWGADANLPIVTGDTIDFDASKS